MNESSTKRYLIKFNPNSKPIIYQSQRHDEDLAGILHTLCTSYSDTWKMDVVHYFYVEMGSYFYPISDGTFLRGFSRFAVSKYQRFH